MFIFAISSVRINHIALSFLLCLAFGLPAQIISRFTWDSNPVLTAINGPNATSAGGSATSSTGGVGGTNGLNPGAPTANDINLTIPNTSNVFDVNNVDISIDYRRNESTAQIVKRSVFTFNNGGAVGNFQVVFRVGTGPTVVTSTAYPIPQDATFRTYRFTYNSCTGVGTMYVNGTTVWSSPTPTASQNLYWTGDGNVVIGQDMDGANNNVPNLDNFIWQTFTCTALPIELRYFTGTNEGSRNCLKWATATEKNNDFFTLEQSLDGSTWRQVAIVYGAGNSSYLKTYSTYDNSPAGTVNYYRLTQTDFDGRSEKFNIIVVNNTPGHTVYVLKITDLLGREVGNDYTGLRFIHYSDGQVVKKTDY